MAANIEILDIHFPMFTGQESSNQKIQMLTDYIFQQSQGLRYVLENLGSGNWNQADLKNFQDATTKGVDEKIEIINRNIDGIKSSINDINALLQQHTATLTAHGTDIAQNKTDISAVQTKANETAGKVATLEITYQGDGEGGGTIGKEGKRIDLVGNFYLNGQPLKP